MKEHWMLPRGWFWRPLEELCKLYGGGTPSRSRDDYFGGQIVWITPSDLEKGGLISVVTDSETKLTQTGINSSSARLLPVGTILFSSRATIGKVAISGIPLATNQGFINFVCSEAINNKYLAYCLRTLTTEIAGLARSTTYAEVSKSAIRPFKVPIPYPDDPARSLDTQRRIVARIESLLAEVREMRELQADIENSTGRLMDAILDQELSALSTLYDPVRLGNVLIANIIPGQHIMASDYGDSPLGIPYITGPADFGDLHPVISRWTNTPKRVCKPGDVLFTVKGAGVGKTNLAPLDGETAIGRQIMAIRPNQKRLSAKYLYFNLIGRFTEFQRMRYGVTIPGIRKEHVEDIEIPLPPIHIQNTFVSKLESIQSEIQEMVEINRVDVVRINSLEQAILTTAFRGEL